MPFFRLVVKNNKTQKVEVIKNQKASSIKVVLKKKIRGKTIIGAQEEPSYRYLKKR